MACILQPLSLLTFSVTLQAGPTRDLVLYSVHAFSHCPCPCGETCPLAAAWHPKGSMEDNYVCRFRKRHGWLSQGTYSVNRHGPGNQCNVWRNAKSICSGKKPPCSQHAKLQAGLPCLATSGLLYVTHTMGHPLTVRPWPTHFCPPAHHPGGSDKYFCGPLILTL